MLTLRLSSAGPALTTLDAAMRRRRRQAFRPGTTSNHRRQAAAWITFCFTHGLNDIDPSPDCVCWFIEHLTSTLASPRAIRNYISGLRTWHTRIAGPPASLDSAHVRDMLRALDRTLTHVPRPKLPLTQDLLLPLFNACPSLGPLAPAMRVALLFGYYGFLRQSNLAPRSPHAFTPRRDTCRGDALLAPPGVLLILRWTKTLQRGDTAHVVPLPARPGHPLCPEAAYKDLLTSTPTLSPNHPLLQIPAPPSAPLTRRCVSLPQLTSGLRTLLQATGLAADAYSLHSLRAGGATDAHRAGASALDIQRHGAWASSAYQGYLAAPQPAAAPIPRALTASHTGRPPCTPSRLGTSRPTPDLVREGSI